KNDFWEYDPATDVWTKRATLAAGERWLAVGFSIGSKGYIGTGYNEWGYYPYYHDQFYSDFYEYDPATNKWTGKASFGGTARQLAAGFSIGTKGYIGCGDYYYDYDEQNDYYYYYYKDFWEYDPNVNTWTEKAVYGGPAGKGVGLSIGSKGYICSGKDFWEYTPEMLVTCNVPTLLSTGNITATNANLKWQTVSGALSYKIRYKVAGTSEWNNTKSLEHHKTLNGLAANTEYAWQVKSFCEIDPVVSSEWSPKEFFTTAPLKLTDEESEPTFLEIYPNPFSASTTISFSIHQNSRIQIELLDIAGRKLRILLNENVTAGNYELNLNRDQLSAGIYFLRMKINAVLMVKKMVVE
ncbi:MAG: T9SS type A sorting domain-containing protein, partial [Chitinophagales bacterium]